MQATFTEDQEALGAVARELGRGGLDAARRLLDRGEMPPEPTGSLRQGFWGLGRPVDAGGDGGGLVELAIVVEALARSLTPTPWFAHALATQVALGSGLTARPEPHETWTLAAHGDRPNGWWDHVQILDGNQVSGTRVGVPYGDLATRVIVVDPGGSVAIAVPGSVTPRSSADPSRPVSEVAFDGVADEVADGAEQGLYRAIVVAAADLCGASRGGLELAAAYARTREQFGTQIGRFQGVAHQLADSLVRVQAAWHLTLFAAWALEADQGSAPRLAHEAKAAAGAAAVLTAERVVQVHGGIGMTWESNAHLFLRRALAGDTYLGSSRWHQQQAGQLLLEELSREDRTDGSA